MKISFEKFAPSRCDLPTMLDNVAVILRIITINIDKNYTKRIPWLSYFVLLLAAASYSYIYMFSMLWFVFVRCRETGDFTSAAVVFAVSASSSTCATKLLFMILYKNTVQGIVQRYLECDSKVLPETRISKNLFVKLLDIKKRVIFVWFSLILLGAAYVLRALLTSRPDISQDSYVIYGLEPPVASPYFEIASTFMALTVCTFVYTLAGVTAFILVIIGYIESQMLTLSDEMLSLWEDGEKYYDHIKKTDRNISVSSRNDIKDKIINKYVNDGLKQIITFHVLNINLINDFEAVFRVTKAVEFTLIIVAIVAELLGGLENVYLELPYSFLQIYMDCYAGQKLIDASNIYERSIYNCKWENFDKTNMKIVLLMLQSAQKSLTLTAGGLAALDFVTLMSAIKSTYSIYTTLHSTVN